MFQSHKTATGRKRFKRYFTGREQNGKGSWQRESQISDEQLSAKWCEAHGHRVPEGWDACVTCGAPINPKEE